MSTSVDELLGLIALGNTQAFRWSVAAEAVWLELLRQRPDAAWDVAMNKRLPDGVQAVLARHQDARIRRDIALHNRVSAVALEHLVGDADASVRATAAQHRIPEALLKRLARDEDENVRASVALNPDTPRVVLIELAADPSEWVAEKARHRLV
jgi:hypothetical protein